LVNALESMCRLELPRQRIEDDSRRSGNRNMGTDGTNASSTSSKRMTA